MRKLVLLSPYFPPSTLAGVHRARHLAKHLPNFGWRPIVVCVDEAHHRERLDPDLAQLVPLNTVIEKCGAVSARVARFAAIGDISLRAWRPLRRTLWNVLARYRPQLVLITGSPYYPMLYAKDVKERLPASRGAGLSGSLGVGVGRGAARVQQGRIVAPACHLARATCAAPPIS